MSRSAEFTLENTVHLVFPYMSYLPIHPSTLSAVSQKTEGTKMADGGELTAAAATGDLKVCFLKAAFFIIRRCELELYKYCESYT